MNSVKNQKGYKAMKYEAPVLNTKYGVCTIDVAGGGRIMNADAGFCEMTGYTPSELKAEGFSYSSLIIKEERDEIFEYMKKKTVTEGMACLEYFVRRKNGTVMTVSCFTRSLGSCCIDIMLTENIGNIGDFSGKGYDSLTGFYNYESAMAEIKRILMLGKEEYHSCVLFRAENIDALEKEYGKAFAGTIIENIAIFIHHQYRDKGSKVVMARISRDTFMVLHCDAEPLKVEANMRWSCKEINGLYYGRDNRVSAGVSAGVYHMQKEDTDFDEVLRKAGMALEYSSYNGNEPEVYIEGKDYPDYKLSCMNVESGEGRDRAHNYDNRFISFAVSLLASAKDYDSSLDILLQRIGWHYGFEICSVVVFENKRYGRVTNCYFRGKGIVKCDSRVTVYDLDQCDGFFQGFDSNGCMMVADIERADFSESDKQHFRNIGIRSVVNHLLYDNEQLVGYVNYSAKEPKTEWNDTNLNTLTQLSKIIALFVSMRIHKKENEQRYEELAIDPVTGLHVYQSFIKEAQRALYNYDSNKTYAIVYSDIDNFSYVNENFGYDEGDEVLKRFSYRIQSARSSEGICCHINADKFIVLTIRNSREEIEKVVSRINRDFYEMKRKKYPFSEMRINTGIYYVEKGCDIITAVDRATHVWKHTKGDKYKLFEVYTEEFEKQRQNRINIIGSVHSAINNGEIESFLQPKFSMKTMEVLGAEALARWRNPDGSYRFPNEFIPVLEDARFIIDVDFCIFEQVLQALARWERNGGRVVPVSVNFSRQHMHYTDFVDRIKSLTKKYGVSPKNIEIEITESAGSKHIERMLEFMRELREDGYRIDIDDFGTGYSSLNMLLDVPVDVVKVDKSFIDHLEIPQQQKYIDRIGQLILTAKKDIIFEGVETQSQLKFLVSCGYEQAQGYIFSKPIPMKDFEEKYIYVKDSGKNNESGAVLVSE